MRRDRIFTSAADLLARIGRNIRMKRMQKTFQIVLVTFLVIFTTASVVLLVSALTSLLAPAETAGVFAASGGIAFTIIKGSLVVVLLVVATGIYLITRRNKVR